MKVKKIGIVSLSSGVLGEDFVQHEVELGVKRLEEMGVEVVFAKHAKDGLKHLFDHPEDRASDLLEMFQEESVDMILCAIGGIETYRLLPYLFEKDQLKNVLKDKIFLGFSDTTANHFMFAKLGLPTFYGQAFLPDVCELSKDMYPYSKSYFKKLLEDGDIDEIRPSKIWYSSRSDYSKDALGTDMPQHENEGFVLLQGKPIFHGKIFGGCIETIYDMLDPYKMEDCYKLTHQYHLFPELDYFNDKILLLESSETKSSPDLYRKMIQTLNAKGIFDKVQGVLIGKPDDEIYQKEYHQILLEEINNKDVPIVANVNIGHAQPRCIIPLLKDCIVDTEKQRMTFTKKDV